MRTILAAENDDNKSAILPEWVRLVQESVGSLQFGLVQIVVHNSKVVQIEKTEKVRLDSSL
jgi:hypothetical protein